MKTNLKDDIWIEGFDELESINLCELLDAMSLSGIKNYIYKGKTSDIPEELAKECVVQRPYVNTYLNYSDRSDKSNHLYTAKQSIQSACNQEYCIIYRDGL